MRLGVSIPVLAAAGPFAILVWVCRRWRSPFVANAWRWRSSTTIESKAAATRDADRVASFYADDAIAYSPNEPVAVGRPAAEKVWASYFADPTYSISWKRSTLQ